MAGLTGLWKDAGVPFDDEDPTVIGKTVLIGITYFDATGRETGRAQWWGRILAFNMRDGLKVDLGNNGQPHAFPPFPDGLLPAAPGVYQLRSSGEKVQDPDFLYTVRADAPTS